METILFVVIIGTAFVSLGYALKKWLGRVDKRELPRWRQTAVWVGFFAVVSQAVLFLLSWGPLGRDYRLFAWWARGVFIVFGVGLPCVLAARGATRLWLALSCVLFFVVCFFIALSP